MTHSFILNVAKFASKRFLYLPCTIKKEQFLNTIELVLRTEIIIWDFTFPFQSKLLELFSLTGFAFVGYLGQVKIPVNIIYEIKPGTSSGTKEEEEEETPNITVFYISIKILVLNIMVSAYLIYESTNCRLSC